MEFVISYRTNLVGRIKIQYLIGDGDIGVLAKSISLREASSSVFD